MVIACRTPEAQQSNTGEPWIPEGVDTTVLPAQDFYQFATGGLPATGRLSLFQQASADFDRQLLQLLRSRLLVRNSFPEGTDQRKLADFFYLAFDSARADRLGLQPVRSLLQQIASLDKRELTSYLAQQALVGASPFFDVNVRLVKPTGPWRLSIERPALLAPGQEKNPEQVRLLLVQLLRQAGFDEKSAQREAQVALKVILELLEASPTPQQPVWRSITELDESYSFVDWTDWMSRLGIATDSLLVADPFYLRACQRLVDGMRVEELRSYLRGSTLLQAAPVLGQGQRDATDGPRWRQVVSDCKAHFGDVIGRWYVRENFTKEKEADARLLVDNCRLALAGRLKELTWMSDSTKEHLLQRLKSMQVYVGHPEQWQTLAGLQLPKDSLEQSHYFYVNQLRAFANQLSWQKLTNQSEAQTWPIGALEPRLYFDAERNQLFLPAAVLQSPLFQAADPGVHYARIGYLVSLELAKLFKQEAIDRPLEFAVWRQTVGVWQQSLIKTAAAREVSNRPAIDEALENVALSVAFEALERYLRENPGVGAEVAKKRFLVAWAQHQTGLHAAVRTNATLQHFEPFADLFQVRAGDGMWVEESKRTPVWQEKMR